MFVSYEAEDYSRGRSTVMGVATVLVLWFHCTVVVAQGSFLGHIRLLSDMGVDLFFFASGVGIFFAVEKYKSYGAYLTARFVRILPAFFLVTVLWSVYRRLFYWEFDASGFWLELTTLNFWLRGDLSCWYIAGTLVLYLLTPGYIRMWKKCRFLNLIAVVLILMLGDLSYRIPQIAPLQNWLILLFRLPVYLMGLQMGKAIRERKQLRIFWPGVLAVTALCLFVIASCYGYTPAAIPWSYKYVAFCPMAVIASLLLAKVPKNAVTGYFGLRSLEMYLVFEKVLEAISMRPQMEVLDGETRILKNLLAMAITLVLVESLRIICKSINIFLEKYAKVPV